MFDLQKFYSDAFSGQKIDYVDEFVAYVKSHKHVILWGAGNLGTAIGKKFIELGITIDAYWDAKFDKLLEVNSIRVLEPFSGDFDKKQSLIIFCIANVPVAPRLYAELSKKGWINVVRGLAILQGILCPLSLKGKLDTGICTKWNVCVVCSCERLSSLMKSKMIHERKISEKDFLGYDRVHFIVNNYCNLKCTHCFMYMNSYPNERKKNMTFKEISSDIDCVMQAVDSFGVVNVFGGETFLNPDISSIVAKILEYKNFGSLIVNTNGVANISGEQLASMNDSRLRLAFSNYLGSLKDIQETKYFEHIEFCRQQGINVQTNNEMPTWNISSTLCDNKFDIEYMKKRKSQCNVVFLYVFDHKIFPCAMALSINDLGIADYKSDYIDISEASSPQKLKQQIRELMSRPYFQSCSHCDDCTGKFASKAGQQGFDPRYTLPSCERGQND